MSEPTLVITTRNRAEQLRQALLSIRAKNYVGLDVVIVDDASSDGTADVLKDPAYWPFPGPQLGDCQPNLTSKGKASYLCGAVFAPDSHFASYTAFRLQRDGRYRTNPATVINFGHRQAKTDVVIEQCAEICHLTDCIEPLMKVCQPGCMAIARVYCGTPDQMHRLQTEIDEGSYNFPEDFELDVCSNRAGTLKVPYLGKDSIALYTGLERPAPFLFLGAIHKKDFEAVKGYDEKLSRAADDDLANRLLAKGVKFCFVGKAIAFHLKHGKS